MTGMHQPFGAEDENFDHEENLKFGFEHQLLKLEYLTMYRRKVNKRSSASSFRHNTSRTKAINMRGSSRGGFRL